MVIYVKIDYTHMSFYIDLTVNIFMINVYFMRQSLINPIKIKLSSAYMLH